MKWICECFVINTLWNSKMIGVWHGYCNLCFLSGPVMRGQTFVGTQNNTTANDSVCNWTEKGNNGQKQLSTSQAAVCWPPLIPAPASPSPNCAMTYCHGKNYLFSPIVGLLQISCSVCGPGLFLCSEAWIPDLAMSCCTAQQRDALRLRQHITGCCCCHPCRLPLTYSSFPWSDPHGSPRPCEVACARWCGLGPWPPRSWWSCAGGRTHGWLKRENTQRD